jgi:hypothetical protein
VGAELRRRTRELAEQANELHERSRSLPPDQFLQESRILQASAHQMLKDSLLKAGRESAPVLLEEIKIALEQCLRLAWMFEAPQQRHGRWAVNVMLYLPVENLEDRQLEEFAALCPYRMLSFARRDIAGVLFVRKDLSLAVEIEPEGSVSSPAFPDARLRDLALPVPERPVTDSEQRLRVLPGAPLALYSNLPAGYADTRSMGKEADLFCDLPRGTADAMRDYFAPDKSPWVRSLISMPLLRETRPGDVGWHFLRASDQDGTQSSVSELLQSERLGAGILNIHRNRERMACTDERSLLFYPVMVPLLGVVRDLVELYDGATPDSDEGS